MTRSELEALLIEDEDLSGYKLYVWGTGNTASLYQEGFARLEKEGIIIEGYGDNNKDKWGTIVFGNKTVYSPDEIKSIPNALVLIASPQPKVVKAIVAQMRQCGIKYRHIDDFILKSHKEEVLACYDSFEDDKSKDVYSYLVKCHIEGKYPEDSYVDRDQYFSFAGYSDYDPQEVFVDCGAYVGDSLETYIWKKDGTFKKVIAFEPDMKNVQAMNYRLERLKKEWNFSDDKFEIYPYGIGEKDTVNYVERYDTNNGFGSKILSDKTDNSQEIKIVSIDSAVKEPYSFLKADIESYEYKMLLGAKDSIKKYMPKLAICIYHNAVDFYSILLLIKEINPNYKFAVRHYTHMLSDTVLYAYRNECE